MTRWLAIIFAFVLLCTPVASVLAAPRQDAIYVVQPGDNLSKIAVKFNVTVSALLKANSLSDSNKLKIGQSLIIPGVAGSGGSTPSPTSAGVCGATYTVQSGDKLVKIAEKCGLTFAALLKANNLSLSDANKIKIGRTLIIPGGVAPAPVTPNTPVAGAHGLTGHLELCEPKPSYADTIERICVREWLQNHTNATVTYGVIGVRAENLSGGPSQFHTSWLGELAIDAKCSGPRDRCGGSWEDGLFIGDPGTYRLTLGICYSSLADCQKGGDWETLTPGITIQVVFWRPA